MVIGDLATTPPKTVIVFLLQSLLASNKQNSVKLAKTQYLVRIIVITY